jgi:hypothetical protein
MFGLFSFTHEKMYVGDYISIGTKSIWQSANGKEVML